VLDGIADCTLFHAAKSLDFVRESADSAAEKVAVRGSRKGANSQLKRSSLDLSRVL